MEMEGVVTDSPRDGTFFVDGGSLIRLAFDAEVHNMITTDGAIVHDDVWAPRELWISISIGND